jgi:predicted dehydrogenase
VSGIRVGVAGLRFGAEFVPLYLGHPDVASVAICDADPGMLARTAEAHGIGGDATFGSVADLLAADVVDAVHIATPVRFHVEQALAVLSAGKHCASAVPMATDLDGIRRILAARQAAGTNYMMMETMVFEGARARLWPAHSGPHRRLRQPVPDGDRAVPAGP